VGHKTLIQTVSVAFQGPDFEDVARMSDNSSEDDDGNDDDDDDDDTEGEAEKMRTPVQQRR